MLWIASVRQTPPVRYAYRITSFVASKNEMCGVPSGPMAKDGDDADMFCVTCWTVQSNAHATDPPAAIIELDRTSCHRFLANQLRVLMTGLSRPLLIFSERRLL